MRNLIVVLVCLIAGINIYSQTSEPPPEPTPWLFKWGYSDSYRVFAADSFQQKSMILGFQWAGSRVMSNFLLHNTIANHGYEQVGAGSRTIPLDFVSQPTWLDGGNYEIGAFNAPFMNYSPALPLTPADTGKILLPNDRANPVFGFLYHRGTIDTTASDNYYRLKLTEDEKTSYGSDTVLRHIWPQPGFKTREFISEFRKEGQTDNYLGRKWYLAINLRRLNISDTMINNDVVLSLKIRYKGQDIQGNIKFDSIPVNNQSAVTLMSFYQNRGYVQNIEHYRFQYPTQMPDSMIITNRMIPAYLKRPYKDITIKAVFFTYPDENEVHFPFISVDPNADQDKRIDSIDIIVSYFGHLSVLIKDIRIESVNAHHLLCGRVDRISPNDWSSPNGRGYFEVKTDPSDTSNKEQINDIWHNIQTTLNAMKIKTHTWRDARLFRFYYQDTECDKYYWWGPLRYLNLATNGLYITRDAHRHPLLYEYYTKCPNRWIGTMYNDYDALTPPPYCRNGQQSYTSLGIKYGYVGTNNSIDFPDTLNSGYETNVLSMEAVKRDSYYYDSLFSSVELLQPSFERVLYNTYYSPGKNNDKMLYSEKPWWIYTLFYNVNKLDTIVDGVYHNYMIYNHYRPKTAEEHRLLFVSALLRGAKGFINDGDWNGSFLPKRYVSQMSIGDSTQLKLKNNLYNDTVGTDYLRWSPDQVNDTWYASTFDTSTKVNLDTLSRNLQIPQHRIFIGTKSLRTELYKFNTYIRSADSLLMRLRLAATLSKGYRTWYSQDKVKFGTDTLLKKFISLKPGDLYTKKIWNAQTNQYQQLPEAWDSTFLDITMLRDKDDLTLNGDRVFMGIHNRRADCLINYYDSLKSGGPGWELRFFSAAEMDILCTNGGRDPVNLQNTTNYPASHWQQYWWRRIGARELNLKFDYRSPADTNEYCLLRVTELDKGTSHENVWWRKEPFNNRIDTVIGQDAKLAIKLLPSEGKILSIEVLHPPKNITGKLEFSNQSKLVAFPVYIGARKTDSIRYHLVYYRPTQVTNPPKTVNMVYYVRSKILWKDSPDENIVWETPVCISDTICNAVYQVPDTLFSYQCQYPSIVVRKDGAGSPRAYIVYSCDIDTECGGYIAETELDVGTTNVIDNYGNVLSKFISERLHSETYGIPCINASVNGNYYAWSDSTIGIIAGFKIPGDLTLRDTARLKFSNPYPGINTDRWGQPSMNVYSDIVNGCDNSSLIWREQDSDSNKYTINYTKLKYIDGELSHYIPKACVLGRPLLSRYAINSDTTIACISKSDYNISYPIISRSLEYLPYADYYTQSEAVFWQETEPRYNGSKISENLKFIFISVMDSSNIPKRWLPSYENTFKSFSSDLFSPNINNADIHLSYFNKIYQGKIIFMDYAKKGGYGLDFIYLDPQFNERIAHIPITSHGSFYGSALDVNTVLFKKIGPGRLPHLSNYPYYEGNSKVWASRQVFNHGETSVPDIWASANGYYREAKDDYLEAEPMVGFKLRNTGNIANYMISLPFINDEPTKLNLPYEEIEDSINGNWFMQVIKDTLNTDWFEVGANSEITFKCKGRSNNKFCMLIEKENDTIMYPVYLPETMDDSVSFFRVIMINGLNENYRVLFINKDTVNGYYTEDLFIGGVPVIDTIMTRKSNDIQVVNLNPGYNQYIENKLLLIARPNPASDKIEVRVIKYENEEAKGITKSPRFKVVLYSFTGEKLYETELNGKQSTVINTENYSPGSYIIRAEEIPSVWGDTVSSPAVEKIIISR